MKNIILAAALFFAVTQQAHAAEFTFKSKLDVFTVDVNDGGAFYNGEQVSVEPFKLVKPLFDSELGDECDKGMGRPELTITRKRGEKEEKRILYIEKKIVSDGQNCGSVEGHGLYQLPLHHNWFAEKKAVTIGLGDEFAIYKDNREVVRFKKSDGRWKSTDTKLFINWSFFEKFTDAVREFPIDFRAHLAAAKDYANFELRQGSRNFLFVKVAEKTWAVKFPGSPWLAASGQFGFFDDMNQNIWLSPYSQQLQIVKDKMLPGDKRIAAIRALNSFWGPDVKYTFHDVLMTGGDNVEVKREIAALLKTRPTDENFKILVDSLRVTEDRSYQETATKVLRVRNPKGATIFSDDEDDVAAKKMADWVKWRTTLK